MKRIFSILVLMFLFGGCCKEKDSLEFQKEIPYVQITLIDNFEVIYQKAGFIELDMYHTPDGYYKFTEYTEKGIFPIRVHKGQYSNLIIEACQPGQEPRYDKIGLQYYKEQRTAEEHE